MWLLRFTWHWLQIVGGIVATLAIAWLIAALVWHLKLLNVQTGSMTPTFRPADALILQKMPASKLKPGMIVSYKSSRNPNELVTHRVVTIGTKGFQTKGDALTRPDPAVHNSLLVGRVISVLPHLGKLLSWIQTLPGLMVCVYIPALAIITQELIRLERHYAKSHIYRLAPNDIV